MTPDGAATSFTTHHLAHTPLHREIASSGRATPKTVGILGGNVRVAQYWAGQQKVRPVEAFRQAARQNGRSADDLTRDDQDFLATLDEFHCLNKEATDTLARLAGIDHGAFVLDVGCGLGGPARRLAFSYGCELFALDITKEFLEVASGLTDRLKLSHKIKFVHWDAGTFRFPQQCFDFAWMQVAAANIVERDALYYRLFSALRPRGRLALYDIFKGPNSGIHFPVPWSLDGTASVLITENETITKCEALGFRCIARCPEPRALTWFKNERQRMALRGQIASPTFGFEVLLPRWLEMCVNQIHNISNNKLWFGYLVFEKA